MHCCITAREKTEKVTLANNFERVAKGGAKNFRLDQFLTN